MLIQLSVTFGVIFLKIIPDDNARGKLFYAFLELIKEKPYQKIKISELIEKAQINRTTFYRYYSDIFEFFDRISSNGITYLLDGIKNTTVPQNIRGSLDNIYKLLTERIDIFSETIRLLTGKHGNLDFLMRFYGYAMENIENAVNPKDENERNLVQFYVDRIYVYLLCSVFPKTDLDEYKNIDFRYIPAKTVVENTIDMLSAGKSELSRSIMASAAKIFLTKEPSNLNVNNITTSANVSRTEFYNFFGNIRKLVAKGMWAACFICSQEITVLCTCDFDEFIKNLSSVDYGYIINNDNIINLARHHREYYQHMVSWFYLTRQMLIEAKNLDTDTMTDKQKEFLDFFVSWATVNFVSYSDDKTALEYRDKIKWAKNYIEENI